MKKEYKRRQIPAFGNWDVEKNLPMTQYFESAKEAGLIRFHDYGVDASDPYGDGDYLKKPRPVFASHTKVKESLKGDKYAREGKREGTVCDATEAPRPRRAPKAVDEDLYKIPAHLLRQKPKRNRVTGFLSRCLVPDCAA